MRNHDEKIKDMAESILPSTARKGARQERARIHRRERAQARAALYGLRGCADPDDSDGDGFAADRRGIQEMVWDRRSADKVGPLLRWAERTIAADPRLAEASYEERYDHFARLLPDNTIGRHALQHLRLVLRDPDWRTRWVAWRAERAVRDAERRSALCDAVKAILEAGAHGELNRRIKCAIPAEGYTPHFSSRARPRRLLLGAHDVEDFVDAVRGAREASLACDLADELRRPKHGRC